jgi:hypothetical protein
MDHSYGKYGRVRLGEDMPKGDVKLSGAKPRRRLGLADETSRTFSRNALYDNMHIKNTDDDVCYFTSQTLHCIILIFNLSFQNLWSVCHPLNLLFGEAFDR